MHTFFLWFAEKKTIGVVFLFKKCNIIDNVWQPSLNAEKSIAILCGSPVIESKTYVDHIYIKSKNWLMWRKLANLKSEITLRQIYKISHINTLTIIRGNMLKR